jgi:carbon storage regulator
LNLLEPFGVIRKEENLQRAFRNRTEAVRASKGYTAMLVLSRKKDESIVINNDVVITIVEIRGDKVRLGIEAPKNVAVHRLEVYEAIHGHRPETQLVANPGAAQP